MTFLVLYAIVPYIIYIVSNYLRKPNMLFIYLLILALIRFDTVSDYHNYVRMFYDISNGYVIERLSVEYGYTWLNRLFSFWDRGYILVLGISSLSIYYAMYLYYKRYNVVALAMLIFCATGSYILVENIARQNIAMALLNITFLYIIDHGKSRWYIIPIGILASIFHSSALVVFPIYLLLSKLKHLRISFLPIFITTMVAYILMCVGVFEAMFNFVFGSLLQMLPFIMARYGGYENFGAAEAGFGLGALLNVIMCTLPLLIINKVTDKNMVIFINITWIVCLILIIFRSIPYMSRITDYFFIFKCVAIAYFLITYRSKLRIRNLNLSVYFRRLIIIPFFYMSVIKVGSYFGYRSEFATVFSYRCKESLFYNRTTNVENMSGVKFNAYRNTYYKLVP